MATPFIRDRLMLVQFPEEPMVTILNRSFIYGYLGKPSSALPLRRAIEFGKGAQSEVPSK